MIELDKKSGQKRLIINADDLGYSLGTTRGIIEAHTSGIVTSASAFVNLASSASSMTLALAEAPFLGIGLHVNLTVGSPLTDNADTLTDENSMFLDSRRFMGRINAMDLVQVEAEVRAQVARFVELTGKHPDHLDAHKHMMYMHADLLAILVKIAGGLGVPVRRARADEYAETGGTAVTADMLAAHNIVSTDHFISRYMGAHKVSLGDLLNILMDIPNGTTELMCHPGYVDSELEHQSSYTEWREMEVHALTQPSAREVLVSQQIDLITFADL